MQITHLYNKFPAAPSYDAIVAELNLEDESDSNVPWTDVRNNILSERNIAQSSSSPPTTISAPEFQIRAAFYDFWDQTT